MSSIPTLNRTKQRGFTLIELIVVIVIIGILAAIILVGYGMVTTRAQNARNVSNAQVIRDRLNIAFAETGKLPNGVCGSQFDMLCVDSSANTLVTAPDGYRFSHYSNFADPDKYNSSKMAGYVNNNQQGTGGYYYFTVQFCRPSADDPVTGVRIYYSENQHIRSTDAGSSEQCVYDMNG